jgi:hypothetical protein
MLALVSIGAVWLRCYGLTSRTLWLDEAFTWKLVSFPFVEMLRRATEDNSPPLCHAAWLDRNMGRFRGRDPEPECAV